MEETKAMLIVQSKLASFFKIFEQRREGWGEKEKETKGKNRERERESGEK